MLGSLYCQIFESVNVCTVCVQTHKQKLEALHGSCVATMIHSVTGAFMVWLSVHVCNSKTHQHIHTHT